MKKEEKLEILRRAKGTYIECKCVYTYSPDPWYYYVMDHSDRLMLSAREDDFILDGFEIRRISDLKKIGYVYDKTYIINRANDILEGVKAPEIDLTSWKTVFRSLSEYGHYVIIEKEKEEDPEFHIGLIQNVLNDGIVFSSFDTEGVWDDDFIKFTGITSVSIGSRYANGWENYMNSDE